MSDKTGIKVRFNRFDVAFYALGGILSGVVGGLAKQAGYEFWPRIGWIAVAILLALLYGGANELRRRRRLDDRRPR